MEKKEAQKNLGGCSAAGVSRCRAVNLTLVKRETADANLILEVHPVRVHHDASKINVTFTMLTPNLVSNE